MSYRGSQKTYVTKLSFFQCHVHKTNISPDQRVLDVHNYSHFPSTTTNSTIQGVCKIITSSMASADTFLFSSICLSEKSSLCL